MQDYSRHRIFPNLNGLRTIAAIAVVIYHIVFLNRNSWGEFSSSEFFRKLLIIVSRGHHAIELFFIISGFLITYLLIHEKELRGRIDFRNFLVRRFLRVWPLYFTIVLFGFFVFPQLPFGRETAHSLPLFLLFASNFSEIVYGWRDPVNFLSATWTVSVEEQFYLAWVLLSGVFGIGRKTLLVISLLALIAASLIFRHYHYSEPRVLHVHTLAVMSDLAIGALAAAWLKFGNAEHFFTNLPRLAIIAFYCAFILLLVFEDHLFAGKAIVFARVVSGGSLCFLMLEQIFSRHSVFKADGIPGFYFVGKHTYGIYMYHCIVIWYCGKLSAAFPANGLTFFCYAASVILITWLTARFSYLFLESRFLRLQDRFRN
jgi:peptidoglycan/LPS O-acetylase OafA/YrhL